MHCVSEAAQKYASVFTSIDRSQQLSKYYHKCHRVSLLSLLFIPTLLYLFIRNNNSEEKYEKKKRKNAQSIDKYQAPKHNLE